MTDTQTILKIYPHIGQEVRTADSIRLKNGTIKAQAIICHGGNAVYKFTDTFKEYVLLKGGDKYYYYKSMTDGTMVDEQHEYNPDIPSYIAYVLEKVYFVESDYTVKKNLFDLFPGRTKHIYKLLKLIAKMNDKNIVTDDNGKPASLYYIEKNILGYKTAAAGKVIIDKLVSFGVISVRNTGAGNFKNGKEVIINPAIIVKK